MTVVSVALMWLGVFVTAYHLVCVGVLTLGGLTAVIMARWRAARRRGEPLTAERKQDVACAAICFGASLVVIVFGALAVIGYLEWREMGSHNGFSALNEMCGTLGWVKLVIGSGGIVWGASRIGRLLRVQREE